MSRNVSQAIDVHLSPDDRAQIQRLRIDVESVVNEYDSLRREHKHRKAMTTLLSYCGAAPENTGLYRRIVAAHNK